MWAIWITVVAAALAGFYALQPETHITAGPPDMALALAGDMALYRDLLEHSVAAHPAANGAIPPGAFAQTGNWTYTPQRWENYVVNGIVLVYPASGASPLPANFAAALTTQAHHSIEAGVVENGQIVTGSNAGDMANGLALPGGLPQLSNGTPVWIAQVF